MKENFKNTYNGVYLKWHTSTKTQVTNISIFFSAT